jgi:hypothetical protein
MVIYGKSLHIFGLPLAFTHHASHEMHCPAIRSTKTLNSIGGFEDRSNSCVDDEIIGTRLRGEILREHGYSVVLFIARRSFEVRPLPLRPCSA